MILVGNQRGGASDLARHLLNAHDNEHVRLAEIRGFMSDDLHEALTEAYAMSKGTKCRKFLYSLSLNPPPGEQVPEDAFEKAIERIEKDLGLGGQPRAIVFHEKEGRRHAHAVWSRIDTSAMKAVNIHRDHEKLNAASRDLFIKHGWTLPEGFIDRELSDPTNFTLSEWQQAKRIGRDPRGIKTALQDAWAISDSAVTFAHALYERGYKLARGDRRSFVAVDRMGEVYAIPKWVGVKTKEVRARLGDEAALPGITESKAAWTDEILPRFEEMAGALSSKAAERNYAYEQRKARLITQQREERQVLASMQRERREKDALVRQAKFNKGLRGLWDRFTGRHRKLTREHEKLALVAKRKDASERDALTFRHLETRRALIAARREEISRLRENRWFVRGEIVERRAWQREPPSAPREPRRRRTALRSTIRTVALRVWIMPPSPSGARHRPAGVLHDGNRLPQAQCLYSADH